MKFILSTTFLFISQIVSSQNISFVDIKYLYENNIDDCESYLAKKQYLFLKSEDGKVGEICPSTTWAYKRNNVNNRAKSFLVKTCDKANVGLIFYQFTDNTELEKVKSICKTLGFKFIQKTTSPYGTVWFTYQSN